MTCKVKVTAADGYGPIARALIDPGSSASFVHKRLAQYLRIPCRNKNAIGEGVAGASTRSGDSVWFQVSGIEDDMEKFRVEAYVLKKITKDLPLHQIPAALKWDHLFDLKLADSDFRTPACIDLLLGAEVFTSIHRDRWRTGPQGTPSAINTCFGWVLFGKIEGGNVVDVANHTLEQDVFRELTGARHSYAPVFTADKDRDLLYLHVRQRKRRKSDHKDCRTRQKGFGRFRTLQGARDDRLPPGRHWRGTWET